MEQTPRVSSLGKELRDVVVLEHDGPVGVGRGGGGGAKRPGCLWGERHLRGARLLVRSHWRASSATACGPVSRLGGHTDGEGVC